MPRFFITPFSGDQTILTGSDARHIRHSLRMREGESVTLCDSHGVDYLCVIDCFEGENIILRVEERRPTASEPSVSVTLFQALPKGDKMELIIQKAVELGVKRIVPVITSRCVAKPDGDRADKKLARWQKISDEAASQCGRGICPEIGGLCGWKELLGQVSAMKHVIVLYECGGLSLTKLISPAVSETALIVGCEGGFSCGEIEELESARARCATLGPRILRCETAPLAALSVIMSLTGNME